MKDNMPEIIKPQTNVSSSQEKGYPNPVFELIEKKRKEKEAEEKKEKEGSGRLAVSEQKLREQAERMKDVELFPRIGLLADATHIENQQIDIIRSLSDNSIRINFKLTPEHYQKILQKYRMQNLERGNIKYANPEEAFILAESLTKPVGKMTLNIATGIKGGYDIRSALGLVEITIPDEGGSY